MVSEQESRTEARRLLGLARVDSEPIDDYLLVFLSSSMVDPEHGPANVDEDFVPQGYSKNQIKTRLRRRRQFDRSVIGILETFAKSETTLKEVARKLDEANLSTIIRMCGADEDALTRLVYDMFSRQGSYNEYDIYDWYTSKKGETIALYTANYCDWLGLDDEPGISYV